MASKREEHRELRKRGAGSHHIKDVDFGFNFPTQAPTVARTPRTRSSLQPELPASRTSRKTPASLSSQPTSARANRKNATPTTSSKRSNELPASKKRKLKPRHSRFTPKRRSLNTPKLADNVSEQPQPDLSNQATSERVSENDELEEATEATEILDILVRPSSTKSRGKDDVVQTEEITGSPESAPGSGRRQGASKGLERTSGTTMASEDVSLVKTPTQRQRMSTNGDRDRYPSPDLSIQPTLRTERSISEPGEIDELSPDQPRNKISEGRFSSEEGETENTQVDDDREVAQEISKKRRKRRHSDASEPARTTELDKAPVELSEGVNRQLEQEQERELEQEQDELDPTPVKATSPVQKMRNKPTSPALQRQPKKPKDRTRPRDTIPVTVHRLTKATLYGDDDTDVDILNQEVPFSKRGGVNAVDVLTQVCEEVIEAGLETLEEGGMNAQDTRARKEYRIKLRALEAFQEELRTQMLELTIVLDTNHALGKRVRTSQTELLHLREELMKIKGEREQIALKADSIRSKHEKESKIYEEQTLLNTSLHDIELAVARCKALPASKSQTTTGRSLDILLPQVASLASSRSDEGGILKKVKDFNAFLERAALALEGRT